MPATLIRPRNVSKLWAMPESKKTSAANVLHVLARATCSRLPPLGFEGSDLIKAPMIT